MIRFKLEKDCKEKISEGNKTVHQVFSKDKKDFFIVEYFVQKDTEKANNFLLWSYWYLKINNTWKFIKAKVVRNVSEKAYKEFLDWLK